MHRVSVPILSQRGVLSVEQLESRIAPAAVFINSKTVRYTDLDGDVVTVSSSKSLFTETNLDAFLTFEDGVLVKIDLTQVSGKPSAAGTALSIRAKTVSGSPGDGLVNIGYVDATGVDLRSVSVDGDLGQVDAGDTNLRTPALRALSVRSLGVFGAEYGAPGAENRSSDFLGNVGSVKVLHDIHEASISVSGDTARPGSISRVFVGGSVVGTDVSDTGKIEAGGSLGSVHIGGSLEGGSGDRSGRIRAGGSLGSLFVGGSIHGGMGASSGSVDVGVRLTRAHIKQDLVGAEGDQSGSIGFGFKSKSIVLGGNVLGGDGDFSGRIFSGDDVDRIRIAGNVVGGSGDKSGTLDSEDDIDALRIGGSILGGKGDDSGGVRASGDLKSVRISGNIVGADLSLNATSSINTSGYLKADRFRSLVILGSIVAGENNVPPFELTDSAQFTPGSMVLSGISDTSNLKRGFKVVSGEFSAKILSVDSPNSITLETAFPGATPATQTVSFFSPSLSASGLLYARETFGSVAITGDLRGTATNPVLVVAKGIPQDELPLRARSSIAISKLSVRGSVSHSIIGAGLDDSGTPVNPDAQIGTVHVYQNWVCSNLVAGISPGADELYGTGDDVFATPDLKYTDRLNLISKIAAIRIGGQVLGSSAVADPTDHYGFVAGRIGSLIVSGTKLRLRTGSLPASVALSPATGTDVHVSDILPST